MASLKKYLSEKRVPQNSEDDPVSLTWNIVLNKLLLLVVTLWGFDMVAKGKIANTRT